MTFRDLWPIALLVINLVQGLVLYSFRSALRIAILELKESLDEKYAKKGEIARLEGQLNLAARIDRGFDETRRMISIARGVPPGART